MSACERCSPLTVVVTRILPDGFTNRYLAALASRNVISYSQVSENEHVMTRQRNHCGMAVYLDADAKEPALQPSECNEKLVDD